MTVTVVFGNWHNMISKLETGPARIRKQDKHDSETGMSADSETVIRKLGQT